MILDFTERLLSIDEQNFADKKKINNEYTKQKEKEK